MSNQYVVESGRPPSYLRTAHAQKMKKVEFAMPCHAKLDMARTSVGAVVKPARASRVARAVAEAGVPARLDAAALILVVCMYILNGCRTTAERAFDPSNVEQVWRLQVCMLGFRRRRRQSCFS